MNGLHLTADLLECQPERLQDHSSLVRQCERVLTDADLHIVSRSIHQFSTDTRQENLDGQAQSGVTLTLLLAESHLCLHTWPEIAGVTLDVYVCNLFGDNTAKARAVMNQLIDWFAPEKIQRQEIHRGF